MSHPANQRPADLTRDQLPAWAQSALAVLDKATGGESGLRYDLGITFRCWHYPKLGVWVLQNPRPLLSNAALFAALWPLGAGLLAWAVASLRDYDVSVWRWALGGALVVLGSVGMSRWQRRARLPTASGMLLSRDGIVKIDGEQYRTAPRSDIHEFLWDAGWTCAVIGAERQHWCQLSAPEGSPDEPRVHALHDSFVEWLKTGELAAPEGSGKPTAVKAGGVARGAAVLLAGAVGMCGFLWLTLVLPATSDGGQTATRFINLVGSAQMDSAYAMLSAQRRDKLQRSEFEAELPPQLKASKGFSVNSISGGLGSSEGSTMCVDGWLQGVEGSSSFSVRLIYGNDTWRVDTWLARNCPRRTP